MTAQEVSILQILYQDTITPLVLYTFGTALLVLALSIMWSFVRTGQSSFKSITLTTVLIIVGLSINGYGAVNLYKNENYTLQSLKAELQLVKTTSPQVYDAVIANKIMDSYAQCYEFGYAKSTNDSNISKCPRSFFFKDYLPKAFSTVSSTATDIADNKSDSGFSWAWIMAILLIIIILKRK